MLRRDQVSEFEVLPRRSPSPGRKQGLRSRLSRIVLPATATALIALSLVGCAGRAARLRGVDPERATSIDSSRAYVLVERRLNLPNQVLAIDFPPSVEPVVTPVPLADPGPLRTLPSAIAVSSDGTRLFTVSVIDEGDVPNPRYRLSVVKPADPVPELGGGEVPDFWEQKLGPTFPPLVVSPDADFAYVLGRCSIHTYDVVANRVLPDEAPLPGCGGASLMPLAEPRRLAVVDEGSQIVSLLRIGPSGALEDSISYPFPVVSDDRTDSFGNDKILGGARWAVATRDLTRIWIVTGNGRVFEVNAASGALAEVANLGLSREDYVPYGKVSLSPDGNTMLVGLQNISVMDGQASGNDRIMIVDTATWTSSATIEAAGYLQWLTMDEGGNIYALVTGGRELIVFDGTGEATPLRLPGHPKQLVFP